MSKVSEIITNKIIERLEAGVIPWLRPWDAPAPKNYVSGREYHGINRLLLDGGDYLTFNQIKELGGKLKKGSKSIPVVFYKDYDVEATDNNGETTIEKHFALRYYNVFSAVDVEGIPSPKEMPVLRNNFSIEQCENIVENYSARQNLQIRRDDIRYSAAYYPLCDYISIPNIAQFVNSEHFYATLFHELAHSTGASSRLNRSLGGKFGSAEYAKEELIAEITSAMLCHFTGIDKSELIDNSAAYIASWLKALRNDSTLILSAAARAEKAYTLILEGMDDTSVAYSQMSFDMI